MSDTTSLAFDRPRTTRGIALLWGFAEATLFFVIPDVWISLVALRSTRESVVASGWAIVGALCGGALVYLRAERDALGVLAVFDRLPAIGQDLIARVAHQLDVLGLWSILIGPFTGAPYKLYAAEAPAAGIGLPEFLAISVPARGLRFVLVALVVSAIASRVVPRHGLPLVRGALLVLWAMGYAAYWLGAPN